VISFYELLTAPNSARSVGWMGRKALELGLGASMTIGNLTDDPGNIDILRYMKQRLASFTLQKADKR